MKQVWLLAGLLAAIVPPSSAQPIGRVGTKNHLEQRRIFVRFEFAGDSYRLREWFPRYFQLKVAESGQVEVEAWDQDWDTVTEAQDRINDSGRYSRETRRQAPRGLMRDPDR